MKITDSTVAQITTTQAGDLMWVYDTTAGQTKKIDPTDLLAQGVAAAGLALAASSGVTPYAMVNGTGPIVTWTAPNDSRVHWVAVSLTLNVTSAMTGGNIGLTFTLPDGTSFSPTIKTGGIGSTGPSVINATTAGNGLFPVKANTSVTVNQISALTAGGCKAWAAILTAQGTT